MLSSWSWVAAGISSVRCCVSCMWSTLSSNRSHHTTLFHLFLCGACQSGSGTSVASMSALAGRRFASCLPFFVSPLPLLCLAVLPWSLCGEMFARESIHLPRRKRSWTDGGGGCFSVFPTAARSAQPLHMSGRAGGTGRTRGVFGRGVTAHRSSAAARSSPQRHRMPCAPLSPNAGYALDQTREALAHTVSLVGAGSTAICCALSSDASSSDRSSWTPISTSAYHSAQARRG